MDCLRRFVAARRCSSLLVEQSRAEREPRLGCGSQFVQKTKLGDGIMSCRPSCAIPFLPSLFNQPHSRLLPFRAVLFCSALLRLSWLPISLAAPRLLSCRQLVSRPSGKTAQRARRYRTALSCAYPVATRRTGVGRTQAKNSCRKAAARCAKKLTQRIT